jgi:CRP/FNR family transcriptional regulator, cyclic AMP receptor protein
MHTMTFDAGDTILSEGEAGDTAFLIVSGSVEVSIGEGTKSKSVGTQSSRTSGASAAPKSSA